MPCTLKLYINWFGNGYTFKGRQLHKKCFASLLKWGVIHNESLLPMGSTLKGKNLLPRGANSFLLEIIPFQEVLDVQESIQDVTKMVSLVNNDE